MTQSSDSGRCGQHVSDVPHLLEVKQELVLHRLVAGCRFDKTGARYTKSVNEISNDYCLFKVVR
jgi:hypothetical protein